MLNKILFYNLLLISSLILSGPSLNAKSWENCKVPSDSIIAAINRGDTITIEECEVVGTLELRGSLQKPFMIKNPIKVFGCVFDDSVFFSCCEFLSDMNFTFTFFQKSTIFSGVTFRKSAVFGGCEFEDNVFFWFCRFNMGASTVASSFNKVASFRVDTFLASANFSQCTFRGNASFIDAHYCGDVSFSETAFKEDISFTHTKFDGKVDFTSTRFEKINILWKQVEGSFVCDNQTSFKLMKHFDEQRMLDDVDGVYLFLKNQERMEKPKLQRYLEFWFIQQTCGYGIVWWRPLLTSLIVVMLFTSIYFKLVLIERRLPLPISGSKRFWKKLWNAFYYSINTFIVGIPANWKVENKPKDFFAFRVLTTLERTLGWILLAVFVVTLTRAFIR